MLKGRILLGRAMLAGLMKVSFAADLPVTN